MEIEEAVLVFVKVAEHVEALSLADVVDQVVLQELVDIVGRDLAQLHTIDSFEGRPWLEPLLLGQLLSLLLDDLLVLGDRPEQLKHLVPCGLRQHRRYPLTFSLSPIL